MKYLRVWQKLALLGLVFLIPFAVVTYALIDKANELGIDFNRKEVDGLRFFTPVRSVMRALRDQHSAEVALAGGDTAFADHLTTAREKLRDGITAADAAAGSLRERFSKSAADWDALKNQLEEAARNNAPPNTASLQVLTKLRGDTKTLYETISDESNLTLDPESDSYWLMDIISFRGIEIAEMLTDARNTGIVVLSGKGAETDRAELQRLIPLVDFNMGKIADSMEKSFKYNAVSIPKLEKPLADARAMVKEAVNAMSQILSGESTATTPLNFAARVTEAESSIYSMQDAISPALEHIIEERIGEQQADISKILMWAGLGLILVLIIGWFIMRDITKPLNRVVGIADRIAEGDVSVELVDDGRRDEVGDLIRAFRRMTATLQEIAHAAGEVAQGNLAVLIRAQSDKDMIGNSLGKMGANLSELVGHVQRSGIQVTSSVTEIAATAKEQQATANQIAATTTEIGATSNEIFATSKELVKTMKQVGEVANETASLAERGQTGLTRMGATMGQLTDASNSVSSKLSVLNEKAGSINTVVTTITKVADQTNLLSLNAAIEAEKAGEYGRGFAVVATEIRRLADQTAVATYDIERIVQEMQSAVSAGVMGMDKFSEEVRRGVEVVTQVSEQLGQIIAQVQTLIPSFESVTEGMESQSAGAQQISEALTQLSEGVQQTVESLRQSNVSIENLNEAVRGLQAGVSRFRLKD